MFHISIDDYIRPYRFLYCGCMGFDVFVYIVCVYAREKKPDMYRAMVAEGSFSNRATVTGTAANFPPVKLLILLSLRLETLTVFLKKKNSKYFLKLSRDL